MGTCGMVHSTSRFLLFDALHTRSSRAQQQSSTAATAHETKVSQGKNCVPRDDVHTPNITVSALPIVDPCSFSPQVMPPMTARLGTLLLVGTSSQVSPHARLAEGQTNDNVTL